MFSAVGVRVVNAVAAEGVRHEQRVVALTIPDRAAVLRVLADCPKELPELRGVLLRHAAWRRAEGLT
jgi:hypothetical protein